MGPVFASFKGCAIWLRLAEQVLACLAFRPTLLHKLNAKEPCWPSPRSWEMASRLHQAGLAVDPAVGEAAASEFRAYLKVYDKLPDLDRILAGKGRRLRFPEEPSGRWATTIGLTMRSSSAEQGLAGFQWLVEKASAEWVQLFASDLIGQMRRSNQLGVLAKMVSEEPKLQAFLQDYRQLLGL